MSKELKVGSAVLNGTYAEVAIILAFMEGQDESQDALYLSRTTPAYIASLSLLSDSTEGGQADLVWGVWGKEAFRQEQRER